MAHLYLNNRGEPQRRHSYSAGLDFDGCPYRYYLRRVIGWRESDLKAAFKFGRAFEESLQYFHDHNGEGFLEDFDNRWSVHKEEKLTYTKKERDWDNLHKIGREMLRLYKIRQPSLPIPLGGRVAFQRDYEKEVYVDDPNYGGISVFGKIDIISYADLDDPNLPKLNWKPDGLYRPLIIDIKTAGVNYHENPGAAAFDPQLCLYSWLTGIRDVALLWFTKTGCRIEKGSSVTLLEDAGDFKAGQELVAALVVEDGIWVVLNDFVITLMEEAQGRKADGKLDTTKAATERKLAWLEANAIKVSESSLTRQRMQFNAGRISEEAANNAALAAGNQIQQIVNSFKSKTWINKFSNRPGFGYSNDPYFRAFLLKDEQFKKEYFTQAEENLDDLFAEPEGEEE
jgi:hypothetical protein